MSESTDSIAKHCDRGQETILRVPSLYGDIHGFLDGELLSRSKKKKRFRCEMDVEHAKLSRSYLRKVETNLWDGMDTFFHFSSLSFFFPLPVKQRRFDE